MFVGNMCKRGFIHIYMHFITQFISNNTKQDVYFLNSEFLWSQEVEGEFRSNSTKIFFGKKAFLDYNEFQICKLIDLLFKPVFHVEQVSPLFVSVFAFSFSKAQVI